MDYQEAIKLGDKDAQKVDGGRPVFEYKAILNKNTEEYENVAWVKIFNIGDDKSVIERQKREEDESRWPSHWKAFLENTEVPPDGTPLDQFPKLTPADIMNCKRQHIRTVEELAEFSDGQIKKLGGRGFALKKAAQEFIDYRKGDTSDLLKRIAELEQRIGDDTENGTGRTGRDRVSKTLDAGGKQQPRGKKRAGTRKPSRKKSKKAPVDDTPAGA